MVTKMTVYTQSQELKAFNGLLSVGAHRALPPLNEAKLLMAFFSQEGKDARRPKVDLQCVNQTPAS